MRKYMLSLSLLVLLSCPALADWTGKDASGTTITFKNPNTCSSVVCVPTAQPVDSTGAAFGVTGNPFFVSPAAGATFPVSSATLATAAAQTAAQTSLTAIATNTGAPTPTGTNSIGTVGLNAGTNNVGSIGLSANATGGCTPGHLLSAATNNSTNVKGSAGTLCSLTIVNTTATLGDLRLYDSATAPTCSSATGVVANFAIQSNATSPGMTVNLGPYGMKFSNGIGFCYTGANADNDNTNAATGANINYAWN